MHWPSEFHLFHGHAIENDEQLLCHWDTLNRIDWNSMSCIVDNAIEIRMMVKKVERWHRQKTGASYQPLQGLGISFEFKVETFAGFVLRCWWPRSGLEYRESFPSDRHCYIRAFNPEKWHYRNRFHFEMNESRFTIRFSAPSCLFFFFLLLLLFLLFLLFGLLFLHFQFGNVPFFLNWMTLIEIFALYGRFVSIKTG